MLDLTNIEIDRVTVFHIPEDQPSKVPGIPTGGQDLVRLSALGKDMLKLRMVKALGAKSKGIEVSIDDVTPQSFFQQSAGSLTGDDSAFLACAGICATMLAKAQNNVSLKASKLVVIGGRITTHARPFLAVVKAELQEALSDNNAENNQAIDHLENIFMTESQRLYKVGLLQRTVGSATQLNGAYDVDQHSIHLFDHLMTALETRDAAHYFYSGFLGCQTATSARSRTRDFYDQTTEFIKNSGFDESKKYDLFDALRTELRSNSATISVSDFGTTHMTVTDRNTYGNFMAGKMFPTHAVPKDTEYVKSKLRRRHKIVFTSGVTVSTPPDDLKLIRVVTNEDGSSTLHIPGIESSRE